MIVTIDTVADDTLVVVLDDDGELIDTESFDDAFAAFAWAAAVLMGEEAI